MLSAEDASEPGKYSTSRAPYQRGILDAISDPAVSEVVIMSSAVLISGRKGVQFPC
jgi:phage terminase large subunit GpA-like protein